MADFTLLKFKKLLMQQSEKQTCLVTGGAGFIGSHLVARLIQLGFDVTIIDNLSSGKQEYIHPQAQFIDADIRNLGAIKPLFKGVDFVFHFAAVSRITPSLQNPEECFEVNVKGTENVLRACEAYKIQKVIFAGTSSVYGDNGILPSKENFVPKPLNPYAQTKWQASQLGHAFSRGHYVPFVELRFFNVYGPRQSKEGNYALVMGIFFDQLRTGKELTITGDGQQRRDFVYIDDAVSAAIQAMQETATRGIFNIGSGKSTSVSELASLISPCQTYIPAKPGEVKETLADISRAKVMLNWRPQTPLKQGIKKVLTYEDAPAFV
jgi:UDP-glucose 4-epimerase